MIEQKNGRNPGLFFTGCSDTRSQSIGRGRTIFGQDRLLFARFSNGVAKLSPKNVRFFRLFALIFFSRNLTETAVFPRHIFLFFWTRKSQLWGGYNFKTGWPVSILGHVQAHPLVKKALLLIELCSYQYSQLYRFLQVTLVTHAHSKRIALSPVKSTESAALFARVGVENRRRHRHDQKCGILINMLIKV